jgi:hypothetical protein
MLYSTIIHSIGVHMKIAFIPKKQYKIGEIITIHGQPMRVISYTHTGKNVTVTSLEGYKHQKIVCICTDSPPIVGVTA